MKTEKKTEKKYLKSHTEDRKLYYNYNSNVTVKEIVVLMNFLININYNLINILITLINILIF